MEWHSHREDDSWDDTENPEEECEPEDCVQKKLAPGSRQIDMWMDHRDSID